MRRYRAFHRLLATLGLLVTATAASAHPGHETTSFAAGFTHPFGGIDHLLAMLAVGLYAARQQGTQRWALPAGFVISMLAGAAMASAGVALPMVETGIAASVVVFGLLTASALRLPLAATLPLIGTFAAMHGFAHHAEHGDASMLSFAAGFALATAALHGAGYLLANWLPESRPAIAARKLAGLLIAGTGLVLLGS